jgi:hypothetical protein
MKKLFSLLAVASLVLFTVQCDVIDSDLLTSPNAVSPDNVDPDLLLNAIQFNARSVYSSAATTGGQLTRMRYLFGSTYDNAYTPVSFNGIYQTAYSSQFINTQNLLALESEDAEGNRVRGIGYHIGIAKVLQGASLLTMVDLFGDMPWSEALDPTNFNPRLDPSSDLYPVAIGLIDEGIAELRNCLTTAPAADRAKCRAIPRNDLYFGTLSGNARVNSWIRTANTYKLKAYLNTGNAAGINALVADGLLITEQAHNFTFDFGTNDTNPDSRHPLFAGAYASGPAGGNYMSNSYMNMLLNDKSGVFPDGDPRVRYYIYRQTLNEVTDPATVSCLGSTPPGHFQANDPYCQLPRGYLGRDHLTDDGIPPDGTVRATFGVYPAGGQFDANQGVTITSTNGPDLGLRGAGFDPILTASFTHFMLAEAVLRLGVNGNARDLLDQAVNLSLNAVRTFGAPLAAGTGFEMTNTGDDNDVATYRAVVLSRFDNAANPLSVVIKEYYLALWPNGLEAFNAMRRTGFPNRADNLQPARSGSPGNFYRTMLYPAAMVIRNSNVDQKASTTASRTFWDTRGADDEFNF